VNEHIIPIREGVVPDVDLEREMVDFVQTQLRRFKEDSGQPPTRIAVAIMGKGSNDKFYTRANSWDAREEVTRIENCGLASTLFLQRALEDD